MVFLVASQLPGFGQKDDSNNVRQEVSDEGEPIPRKSEETVTDRDEAESTEEAQDPRLEGVVPAPAFPTGLDWINVDRPLTWDDLKGKAVLIDFWTYGCINCIHMIPVLEELQQKYKNELVVIGVHSAKFETEGETENIRQIVARYERDEPIINDRDFRVWRTWGAKAWPTIAIVAPNGNVVAMGSGEYPFEVLDEYIGDLVEYHDRMNTLDRSELKLQTVKRNRPDSLLRYPGKVLVDSSGGWLFVADSNHHRIIIATLEGSVVEVIGSGEAGFDDGSFRTASFKKPQGMALEGDNLYVADLDNHAIRVVDLEIKQVSTIAGTGQKGRSFLSPNESVNDPSSFALRSPWDVELDESGNLYIAMAGAHQIWAYSLAEGSLSPVVGDGREALLNGTVNGSSLAQPSGLHFRGDSLFFADSESSSIRVADFAVDQVVTLSGPKENTLFVFGDVDGVVGNSRLQHPLGITGTPEGVIYITDTYNSRIKKIGSSHKSVHNIWRVD